MQINWIGHACFRIRTKNAVVITDPYEKSFIGLHMPKTEADIALVSHDHEDHNNIDALKGDFFTVDSPGEYSIKDVSIIGIPSSHDKKQGAERGANTIYKIMTEGMSLCHLGDLGCKLTDEQLQQLGEIDILFIPVGGVYTINATEASEVISQIEPRLVVPMHYQIPGLKVKIDKVDKFAKQMGVDPKKTEPSIKIKKSDLPSDNLKVVILEPNSLK